MASSKRDHDAEGDQRFYLDDHDPSSVADRQAEEARLWAVDATGREYVERSAHYARARLARLTSVSRQGDEFERLLDAEASALQRKRAAEWDLIQLIGWTPNHREVTDPGSGDDLPLTV